MNVLIYGFSGKILGGIETFILNMNEHMSDDCVFDYIIDGDICVYRNRIEQRCGKVLFVPYIRKHLLGYIRTFWKILGEQKQHGTRLFYYQLFSMANLLPAFMAKMRGYKVILHAHNNGLQSKSKVYVLIHYLGKFLARFGNFIYFTNSQLSSDYMFGKGIKSELIYNAIDIEKFSFQQKIRDKVRIDQDCGNNTVIGFVGRLSRQKNPLFMIQIFSEILKLKNDCELWIVGEGELKDAMLQEIDRLGIVQSVKWLGRRDDVEQLMQGMDLLLQPSLFEGLGIVLIEAQVTGCLVVSSKDVVPDEVKVSDIMMIDLKQLPIFWAKECVNYITTNTRKKRGFSEICCRNNFNIKSEAIRFETLLLSYNIV